MDYRFAIRCWQDKAGSENAKANVFVGSTKVADEVEVTATSADSPSTISWESTGLTAPAADTSFDIKVVLVNEYYVDASTDRNIHINGIGFLCKDTDNAYKSSNTAISDGAVVESGATTTITDFSDFTNHISLVPSAVTGDQIASDWWSGRGNTDFEAIPVWGGDDTGVTMTIDINGTTYPPA